jgi:signal transduction histidine kinase
MGLTRLSSTQLLRIAGLFTWVCAGLPLLLSLTVAEAVQLRGPAGWWMAAWLLFGVAYWLLTRDLVAPRSRPAHVVLLVLMTLSAVAVSHFSESGLGGVLLMVIAGVLPWRLPLPLATLWLVLQHLALVPVFASHEDFSLFESLLQALLYVGFSAFVFVTSLVARRQAEAREEQRRLNAELRATRALLAESSRLNERIRISRELHDLMGHHLTALSLNLEVASHLVKGPPLEHVRQAQSLAKLLLTDVREVVSQLRDDAAIDLRGALSSLVEGVPGLDIRLTLPEAFSVEDPRRAQVLLRCAQEIITNTVKHAQASRLDIAFERSADGAILIHARDNGRGAAHLTDGHGLTGMRERLAQFGGSLSVDTGQGRGFAVEAQLPLEASP